MPRIHTIDPEIIALVESAETRLAEVQRSWLSEAQRAERAYVRYDIDGGRVEVQSKTPSERVGRVTLFGATALSRSGIDQILAVLRQENANTIRSRVLPGDHSAENAARLEEAGFQRKLRAVYWIAETSKAPSHPSDHNIKLIGSDELPEFARIISINYHYKPDADLAPLIRESSAPNMACFMAYVDVVPIATGRLDYLDDVCALGYGTTMRPYRGRGIQRAMIAARLNHARQIGCEWATASTMGNDRSSRNLVRQGFRKAYEAAVYGRATC